MILSDDPGFAKVMLGKKILSYRDNRPFIRAYVRLARMAKTINQLNSLHIALESRTSPIEQSALFGYLTWIRPNSKNEAALGRILELSSTRLLKLLERSTELTAISRRLHQIVWATQKQSQLKLLGIKASQGHERIWSSKSCHYYRLGSTSQATVIGVGGGNGRMAIPTPTILRFLALLSCDLLLLSKKGGQNYASGVPRLGNSLEQVSETIKEIVAESGSKNIFLFTSCKGTTMGVALASILGIKRGLLASPTVFKPLIELLGNSPVDPKLVPTETSVKDSLAGASFVIAYSSDIATDSEAAHGIHALFPGSELLPISNSPHGVVYPIAKRHHLLDLLSRSFGITTEPRIEADCAQI
jgi:hypothetical protein